MTAGLSVLGIRDQTTLLQTGTSSMLPTPAETRTQLAKNFERHLRLLIDSLLKFLWAEHQQFCLLLSHNCRGARSIPTSAMTLDIFRQLITRLRQNETYSSQAWLTDPTTERTEWTWQVV